MSLPAIHQEYLVDFLVKLLNIPSPTGFAEPAIAFVEKELSQFSQLQLIRTRKGALVAKWEVESDMPPVALTAHVDTLGAVVKEFKKNGRLKLSRIGGVEWPTVETEGVWIFTCNGEKIRGSVLVETASGHIFGQDMTKTPRDDGHMEVRLDARTLSEKETRALGIGIGDCVAFTLTTRRAWQISSARSNLSWMPVKAPRERFTSTSQIMKKSVMVPQQESLPMWQSCSQLIWQ
jgi:putative aminopeptidase FrvX